MADDSLVARRSRRSTAGNRMEAALAEMALDEANKDLDDDNDFVNAKDEEDMFESDFASTDEEVDQEDEDGGERAVHEEEKSARKAARSRLEKRKAAAHAKHKSTFNPQAIAPPVVKQKPKPAVTLDAPELASTQAEAPTRQAGQKRKSQRKHTVLNTSATDSRARETEEKKASAPKKFKPTIKVYSQAELIQRALDNEEGNIKEHKNYLKVEEEKRKKARAIKMPPVEGPLLRWISKAEKEKFKVQVEVPQPPQPAQPQPQPQTTPAPTTTTYGSYTAAQLNAYYTQLYQYLAAQSSMLSSQAATSSALTTGQTLTSQLPTVSNGASSTPSSSTTPATSGTPAASAPTVASTSTATAPTTTSTSTTSSFSTFRLPNTPSTYPFTYYTPASSTTATTTPAIPSTFQPSLYPPVPQPQPPAPAPPPPKQYVEEERIEKVVKNYVVHEVDQRDDVVVKPPWKDTMKAMFGDHVKWEELRVLSGKSRPLGRVKQRCPITGDIAPYLDPRTGVPFADVEAYRVLTELLEHQYIWSPELGCYIGRENSQ